MNNLSKIVFNKRSDVLTLISKLGETIYKTNRGRYSYSIYTFSPKSNRYIMYALDTRMLSFSISIEKI